MSKVNNIILTLKIYSGKRLYDKTGKLASKNQTMKLAYGRLEWKIFLDTAPRFYTEVLIESATEEIINKVDGKDVKKEYNDIKVPAEAISELKVAMGSEPEAKPIKKTIKKEETKVKVVEVADDDTSTEYDTEDLEAVREKYLEVFGKKPHHAKKAPSLNKEISDKLSE